MLAIFLYKITPRVERRSCWLSRWENRDGKASCVTMTIILIFHSTKLAKKQFGVVIIKKTTYGWSKK